MVSGEKAKENCKEQQKWTLEHNGVWGLAWEEGQCRELHKVWGISLPRLPLEEQVAPKCIFWAASLKNCSITKGGLASG